MSKPPDSRIYMLEQAMVLLRRGWSIVPSKGSKKQPCVKWKRYQEELPTAEDLGKWDQDLRPERWGVVTGALSGIVVVDFDGDSGRDLMARWGIENPHVRSGSGGYHLYASHPGWPVPTLNARVGNQWPWPGVDVRGDGGFAVLLGRNQKGPYEWLRPLDPDPWDKLPAELRDYLLRYNQKTEVRPAKPAPPPPGSADRVAVEVLVRRALGQAQACGRNNAGMWLACQLRDNGYSKNEAAGGMQDYLVRVPSTNLKGEREPYTKSEVSASLDQAFARPAREPWQNKATSKRKQRRYVPPKDSPRSVETSNRPERVLPQLQTNNRPFRIICDETLRALQSFNTAPVIFVRSNRLVCVEAMASGRRTICDVDEQKLRLFLAHAADFYQLSRRHARSEVPPPIEAIRAVLAESPIRWRHPPLEALVEAPTLRPDGTVLAKPGYDPSSRLFLAPTEGLSGIVIPPEPTRHHIRSALGLILDLIADFPFVDQPSRANAVATMLTVACRRVIRGLTPLALFDATTQGTGKTLLAEIVSLIVTGQAADLFTAPREPEEWRKQLTSVLREGPSVVFIDNVATRLDYPELCKVLTAEVHRDRLLGKSETVSLPVRCAWIATGNNIQIGGDMRRRCYWVRMEAPCPEPFMRTDFRHPKIKTYVLEKRGELLAALLTLARAWFAAGQPKPALAPLGSFEYWTEVIGGMLQHAGVDGFLANSDQLYEQADVETAAWEAFLLQVTSVFWESHSRPRSSGRSSTRGRQGKAPRSPRSLSVPGNCARPYRVNFGD